MSPNSVACRITCGNLAVFVGVVCAGELLSEDPEALPGS